MVFLGYGKYVRADRIYALEPLAGGERGDGRRTRVWVEGMGEAIVASRTERTILHDMGQDAAAWSSLLDDSLAFARDVSRQAEGVGPMLRTSIRAEAGLDLDAVSRRARRLLNRSVRGGRESTQEERLFEGDTDE
jgi:hypothetical protein